MPARLRPARPARPPVHRLPGHAGAAQERPGADRGLGRGRGRPGRRRPRWCWPAAAAGATRWTRRSARCPRTCAWSGPATCTSPTCRDSSAGRWWWPSRARGEGFGLPVLEAMACGAPVLTTHTTSLPEVGGDAVAYTEPDADSIRNSLRALLDDPARREALGSAGHARAARVHLGGVGRGAHGLLPACGRAQGAASQPSTPSAERDLEAILLVGGQGTRLRPLTIATPKPLLPTAGVPFLAHQLARAAAAGISRVVLATSYRAQMFAEAFGDGSQFGLELDLRPRGRPARHRRRHPQRGGQPALRPGRPGGGPQRRHPVRPRPRRPARPAPQGGRRGHAAPGRGAGPGRVRLRAHRRRRPGHRVPGEDPEPGRPTGSTPAATCSAAT